jgi:hypothetical protein
VEQVADETHLHEIVFRTLSVAKRICDRFDDLQRFWPVDQGAGGDTELDKVLSEASILLMVACRSAHGRSELSAAVVELGKTLANLVRGPRARVLLMRSRRYAELIVIPHTMLTMAGHPDPQFDRLVGSRSNGAPAVECAAFRLAESRWIRGAVEGTTTTIDDLLPFSVFNSEIGPFEMNRMDVYALTHWLMYASDFGNVDVPPALHAKSVALLDDALAWQLATEDLDLLGELLMGATMLRIGWSRQCVAAWRVLNAAWAEFGFVPSPGFEAKQFRALADDAKEAYAFANIYHTQFVFGMLAALILQHAPPVEGAGLAEQADSSTLTDVADLCLQAATRGAAFTTAAGVSTRRPVGLVGSAAEAWYVFSAIATKGQGAEPFWVRTVAGMPEADRSAVALDTLLVRSVRNYDLDSVAKLVDLAMTSRMQPSRTLLCTLRWLTEQQTPEGAIGAHFLNPANISTQEAGIVTGLLSDLFYRATHYLTHQQDRALDGL